MRCFVVTHEFYHIPRMLEFDSHKKSRFVAHVRKADSIQQSVARHLLQTAELAKKHADKIGLPSIGELCGLLHDLGKYSDDFQQYIKSAEGLTDPDAEEYVDEKGRRGKIDHSTAGAQFIWDTCSQKNKPDIFLKQMLALCVASHHAGLIDCLKPDGVDRFSERMEKADKKTYLSEVRNKIDAEVLQRIEALISSAKPLAELKKQAQGALDIEPINHDIRDFRYGMIVRFLFSCLIDADRTDTADFAQPELVEKKWRGEYLEWDLLVDALENRLARFQIRNDVDALRTDISSTCRVFAQREKGLYSLTVPTGGGKTLASLRFALNHAKKNEMTRIIYVVPYTSIIDQNADEVRKIFKKLSGKERKEIVLEHHSNLAPDKETPQGKIIAENWDAQIIYTTAVQFLETLFGSGARGVRRMHQLANAVIIFDEIQTLPVRIVHLFNNAINFLIDLCGSTVVFCTATQPCLDKVDPAKGAVKLLSEHEMMPDVKKLFKQLQRVEVLDKRKAEGWSTEEIAELARENLESSKSVLIVVNTKTAAKKLFEQCRGFNAEVYHLSTSMCPSHRLDVLKSIKECLDPEGARPVLCISTQLIEAGVDVDFGCVIRYLAGLDSIAQAAGRCNRNGRRELGYVYVVNPADEKLGKLEDIRIAQDKAQRVLDEFEREPQAFDNDIIGVEAMDRYYKYYFFERASQMTYPVSAKTFDHEESLLSLLSTNARSVRNYAREHDNTVPPFVLRHSFQSAARMFKAIDTSTQGVIVPYSEEGKDIINKLCSAFDLSMQTGLIKKAQRYAVNLFPNMIESLCRNRGIYEAQEGSRIYCLHQEFYSSDFGVADEMVNDMELLTI